MANLFGTTISFLLSGLVFVLLGAGLWGVHRRLLKAYADKPSEQYRRQLIMLGLSLFGLIFAIVVIPIGDEMQGQLLGLLGIVLSATIALSSTTIVGNAMAGLMLKTLKKIRPGKYITVAQHAGRVSEMDLLHTEIQTEDRDLTTLPNLFLVTNPVTVLRDSGTILSVEVSLGYDAPRRRVEELLIAAAEKADLKNPFVQILELGDFSVTYRVAGLCEDVEQLLANRRKLRATTLDELHGGKVEIVSPNFMTTRVLDANARVIPPEDRRPELAESQDALDDVVFDKAHRAEALAELREQRQAIADRVVMLEGELKLMKDRDSDECRAAENTLSGEQRKLEILDKRITAAEARITDD
ncbi:MAG: mechanosensitive ion channel family protein [Gammaproteobacteria bacterium]|nr:mechanosensitive ion channel family protein [Gammaproteobacteria bacterium]MBT8444404.1 mechanosensitive ion channel family protein [Gammaproteobacteria bacterium]